jgi:hypothetical protein
MSSHFVEHELPSGLRVTCEVMPRVRSAAAGFLVRTGARDEAPPEHGVSHFLEHMCFKGTARRSAHEINVRYDREMDEVIINCDEGRLRRPLLVLKGGRTVLTRKHMEDIREGKSHWSNLIHEGVIEWLDAEEEEDTFIAVEAFVAPERCNSCSTALSPTDLDWMNPGTPDRDAIVRCKHCGADL